jgi:hypothetical protein
VSQVPIASKLGIRDFNVGHGVYNVSIRVGNVKFYEGYYVARPLN